MVQPVFAGGLAMRVIVAALAALMLAAPVVAEPVTQWSDFADAVAKAGSGAESGYDAATAHDSTRVALAMFEAADAVDRRYASWLGLPVAPAGASGEVAVATAAHDALLAQYPGQKAMIEQAYLLALDKVPDGAPKSAGIAAGKAAAAAALTAGGIDKSITPAMPFWPAATPGVWQATSGNAIVPAMLTLKPWFMTSTTQLRPAPPVALNSARWVADVEEVRRMGSKTSTERSALDTVRAKFWAPYDPTPAIRAIAAQPGRSLVRNARLFAMIAMVGDDLGIVSADGKSHYAFWRPISAIRSGGGNPAIKADPAWEPLLKTPMHPEYPCGPLPDRRWFCRRVRSRRATAAGRIAVHQ